MVQRRRQGEAERSAEQVGEESLVGEIAQLRAALREAKRCMETGEEDMAKMALLIARLSDSLGRALLAQERLATSESGSSRLRLETDRVLREMGLGE